MEATLIHRADSRLRAGWRIAIFLALFMALAIVGQGVASLFPRGALDWVGLAVAATAALVSGWIVLVRLDGRPPGALGFALGPDVPREIGLGLLVGGVLIAAAVLLLVATGSVRFVPDAGDPLAYVANLGWTLAFFALAAAVEELLFRGYAFQALVEGIGAWPAILVSSALFAWAHGNNPNASLAALTNIFLAGVLLAVAYLRTRSLWFATAVHTGWNWTMASLFDFPVSGLTRFDTPLYTAREIAGDWWTGGPFGPEAGVVGTAVMLAGVVWLMRSPHVREAPRTRELEPLVDARLGREFGPLARWS